MVKPFARASATSASTSCCAIPRPRISGGTKVWLAMRVLPLARQVSTAARLVVHTNTVAYRLERVKELTGLDPMQSEDRERLGLGLKAYRIIAPRLPR